jgi:hypothetical protein
MRRIAMPASTSSREGRTQRPRDPAPPGATAEDRQFIERHGDRLSRTTLRAKWTHEAEEGPDRDGQTLATRAHDVIRSWAERRGAMPVAASRGPDGEPRTLRFSFGAGGGRAGGSRLEPISWDQWFEVFDRRQLVFRYQERRRDGSESKFFRLDTATRELG